MMERVRLAVILSLAAVACAEPAAGDPSARSGGAGGKADDPAEAASLEIDCHLGPPIGVTLDVDVLLAADGATRTIHVEDGFASPPRTLDLEVDTFYATEDDFIVYLGPEVGLQIDLTWGTGGENVALFATPQVGDGFNYVLLCQLDP